ncbi:extracellular catalytic domain type 1 short-chain-length polyhydroxyalkanoate depolymerase [Allorhizocola rhizosphaerae]|uniref:extracellular catalytic domain type 1 short-chain-length polyhydroxyalkanoate depolymerase n=1 Tax=Allorhizocola rhizosphaerae TaxID=1872709 RepID=UPI001FE8372E|nr:PHB depolymerase family esterase [Allorhizocola rhizosphaerae]
MIRVRTVPAALAGAVILALGGIALSSPASAATLVEVTSFGSNPGGMRMHIYVPDRRPTNPAIVVAMHGCGGSGPGFYSGSQFASLADQYGFIVIYPTATQQAGFGNCFDTWSDAAKRRGGGSDPVSINSMVDYTAQRYNGDRQRIFATGSSSGGMMTQHMAAVYPDVFKAGASFMGVPFGCFANAADYAPGNSSCTTREKNLTPQQWGDMARQAYPGYSGSRPRMQLWHGSNDTLVPYSRLQESMEQWTNVFGLSQTPTRSDTPQANWNRSQYANSSGTVLVETYGIQGAGHSLPMSGMALAAIRFFGLDRDPSPSPSISPTTSPSPSTSPSTSPSVSPSPSTPVPPGCRVGYTVNAWNTGLTASVTITNTGTTTVNGWALAFTLPSGQTITGTWSTTISPNSGAVTARNVSYNATIATNASVSMGFQANHTGNTGRPNSFTLNGVPCSIA